MSSVRCDAGNSYLSGTYAGFQSICALGASSFAGHLWYNFGPAVTFITTALVAVVVLVYMLVAVPSEQSARRSSFAYRVYAVGRRP